MELTVQDYRELRIGDNIRNVLDLISRLRDFDFAKITEVVKAIQELLAASGLNEQVRAGLKVLKVAATLTATQADDKLVAAIDKMLTDELLAIITRIIGGFLGQAHAFDVATAAADRDKAQAAGVPWAFLTTLALQVFDLLRKFGVLAEAEAEAESDSAA